jgi:hypothetical protein
MKYDTNGLEYLVDPFIIAYSLNEIYPETK